MGIVPRNDRRMAARAVAVLLAVVAVALVWSAGAAHAASDIRVVNGIVRSISTTEIDVDGATYNISGVPLRAGRGTPVSVGEISSGRMVDLVFKSGKLVLVHVYPTNWQQ